MTREDIIRMAREAGATFDHMTWVERDLAPVFERFAALVAAAERERIIAANRPEIEKINAHIKALEKAVLLEREAIAQSLDKQADLAPDEIDRQWAQEMAAAVRARSRT